MELDIKNTLECIEDWIIRWRANVYDPEVALMNIKMLIEQHENNSTKK